MKRSSAEIIAEYGEIPVAKGADGTPRAVFTVMGGGALVISEAMRRRNSIDLVNKRLRQIKNAMVKFWDDRFMQAVFTNASIPTPQPVHSRPMFGAFGAARSATRRAIRGAVKAASSRSRSDPENGSLGSGQPGWI